MPQKWAVALSQLHCT